MGEREVAEDLPASARRAVKASEGLTGSDGDDVRIFALDPFKVRDGDEAHGGA